MKSMQLKVIYIRASHYDDAGYPLRYWRGTIPSNTLNCLKALTLNKDVAVSLAEQGIHIEVTLYDDMTQPVPIKRIIQLERQSDTRVLVGLAGVQTNQFPRASDLALTLRKAGIAVMMGGFHVSGTLAMYGPSETSLQPLLDAGVTLVKGEVESPGVLQTILRDAVRGNLRPVYEVAPPPSLEQAPAPRMDPALRRRAVFKHVSAFDTSRGCPFDCTFCTIISVQGRKMRHRSAASLLAMIAAEYRRGINAYFVTDDNFSRSPIWENLLDGLIALRREQGMSVTFMAQVDTQAHRIPGFVKKMAAAGCNMIFVGMESLDEQNLESVGKHHNHASQYQQMVEAWRKAPILVHVGYIIGFPYDTEESVRAAVVTLRDVLKIDQASFFMLTPLPGSADHKRLVEEHTPLDADLNNYDSLHPTFAHARMSGASWSETYHDAWCTFYSREGMINALLRCAPQRYWKLFWMLVWSRYCALEASHPMLTGLFRMRKRRERRAHFPREGRLSFFKRRASEILWIGRTYIQLFFEFEEIWLLTRYPADIRHALLSEIREKCQAAKIRVQERISLGRYEESLQELRGLIKELRTTLRPLANTSTVGGRKVYLKLLRGMRKVESRLRAFDMQNPSVRIVAEAQTQVEQHIIGPYEEAVIRYVAWRRRLNSYRSDILTRMKSGHIFSWKLLTLPAAIGVELLLGAGFFAAALHNR